MEPDAEVAEWRERLAQQGLAHLFDECRRDNISEYQFVAQLERWLTNLEAKEPQADVPQTPEDALKVARDQHQERLVELQKFRQRLLEQQQRQQQAAEDSGPGGEGEAGEEGEEPPAAAEESDGALPAWVGVRTELIDQRMRVWHALAQLYAAFSSDPRVDDAVKKCLEATLPELEAPIEEAVRGKEGGPAEEVRKLLVPLLQAKCAALPEQLAQAAIAALPAKVTAPSRPPSAAASASTTGSLGRCETRPPRKRRCAPSSSRRRARRSRRWRRRSPRSWRRRQRRRRRGRRRRWTSRGCSTISSARFAICQRPTRSRRSAGTPSARAAWAST